MKYVAGCAKHDVESELNPRPKPGFVQFELAYVDGSILMLEYHAS